MGEKPADTEREITQLRNDMTASLDELERRLRGGIRSLATTEARLTSARTAEDLVQQARVQAKDNASLVGVAGVVVAGAVIYGVFSLVNGRRQRNKPQNRLKRGVRQVQGDLTETAERVAQRLDQSRRQLERGLLPSGVLLKLDPEDGGYVRVSDARLDPPVSKKKGGTSPVIKKFIWAGLLSVFMAVGSVLARQIAERVWQGMTHEEPPTEKSKVKS